MLESISAVVGIFVDTKVIWKWFNRISRKKVNYMDQIISTLKIVKYIFNIFLTKSKSNKQKGISFERK